MTALHPPHTETLTTFSPGKIERRSGLQRQPSKLKMLGKSALFAIPSEFAGFGREAKQTYVDIKKNREARRESSTNPEVGNDKPVKISKLEKVRYGAFRVGMFFYQWFDDFAGFPAYLKLREMYGAVPAFAAVAGVSGVAAYELAKAEKSAQVERAKWLGLKTEEYDGPEGHDLLEATILSSPWVVRRHANAEREGGGAVEIVSNRLARRASWMYGGVNTGLYAAAGSMPWVNGWTAFGVGLAVIAEVKNTAIGYQERVAEQEHNMSEWEKSLSTAGTRESQILSDLPEVDG